MNEAILAIIRAAEIAAFSYTALYCYFVRHELLRLRHQLEETKTQQRALTQVVEHMIPAPACHTCGTRHLPHCGDKLDNSDLNELLAEAASTGQKKPYPVLQRKNSEVLGGPTTPTGVPAWFNEE